MTVQGRLAPHVQQVPRVIRYRMETEEQATRGRLVPKSKSAVAV